jgi:hypothetical protein
MDEKLAVVGQYDKAEMAHLDRIALEGAGIQAFLNEENTVSINWFYTIFAGGIKLLVRQNDLEQARQILQDVRNNPAVDENSQPIFEKDEEFLCPACGSTKIDFETYSHKWVLLSILFLKFPLPVKINRVVCRQCGHKWKQR